MPHNQALKVYNQRRMGFHPLAVAQYNTQGTPTNNKEHITQINALLSNKNTFQKI
jgi:hypothetical protein